MRTKEKLASKEFRQDLQPLCDLLVARRIPHSMGLHPAFRKGPQVKTILGFCLAGKYQILIEKDDTTYSVVRGHVSKGLYEIMNIGSKGKKFKDPERFETPEKLVRALLGEK